MFSVCPHMLNNGLMLQDTTRPDDKPIRPHYHNQATLEDEIRLFPSNLRYARAQGSMSGFGTALIHACDLDQMTPMEYP